MGISAVIKLDRLQSWLQTLAPREQVMVCICAVVVTLGMFFFLAVNPLLDWHEQEKKRLQRSAADLIEARQLASRIKAKQRSGNTNKKSNQNLAVLIDSSLQKNELSMRGFQPGNKNDARLRLENAAYSSLVQLLYDLEYEHGVSVLDLSLSPAKTSGHLMVSMRVTK